MRILETDARCKIYQSKRFLSLNTKVSECIIKSRLLVGRLFALTNDKKIPSRKVTSANMTVNLSGLENMAVKLYSDTGDKALVSAFVLDYVGRAIIAMSEEYEQKFGKSRFVYAGGVMSNSIIKKMLSERFDAFFAEPKLSSDNAVGVAVLALQKYKTEIA